MSKKMQLSNLLCVVMCTLLCLSGCGNNSDINAADNEISSADTVTESNGVSDKDSPVTETTVPSTKENSDTDEKTQNNQTVETDLKPSEGFEFESNGDGTCTITGIGTCTEKDIVIPLESPNGDTVTLIGKYALYSLENVDSITLVNYNYEIDENAFQYGGFTAVNIIGGSPVINKSAFSNCTGIIEENAFQHGDFISLTISNCEMKIEKSAFSSCEDLTSIVFTDSIVETKEYAFYSCGDSAKVEMTNCTLTFDDRTFQYSSLESLTVTGSKVDMGDSVFSSCEDLTTVSIDCNLVVMGNMYFPAALTIWQLLLQEKNILWTLLKMD